jgi:hypothetical protein
MNWKKKAIELAVKSNRQEMEVMLEFGKLIQDMVSQGHKNLSRNYVALANQVAEIGEDLSIEYFQSADLIYRHFPLQHRRMCELGMRKSFAMRVCHWKEDMLAELLDNVDRHGWKWAKERYLMRNKLVKRSNGGKQKINYSEPFVRHDGQSRTTSVVNYVDVQDKTHEGNIAVEVQIKKKYEFDEDGITDGLAAVLTQVPDDMFMKCLNAARVKAERARLDASRMRNIITTRQE